MSDIYVFLQPFVEFGYGIADMFLRKCPQYSEVINNKPLFSSESNCFVCADLKSDNFGYTKDKKIIMFDKEIAIKDLRIIDYGDLVPVAYDDLESFELSIINLYADLLQRKEDYFVYAFTFGLKLRLGLLGEIIFSNILAEAQLYIYYPQKSTKLINVSNASIICMRVIQNYVVRYFSTFGINFDDYNGDIYTMYTLISELKIPHFLKNVMLRFLSEYSVPVSYCKGEVNNVFSGFEILYNLSIDRNDYMLATWILCNQSLLPVAENIQCVLEKRRKLLQHSIEATHSFDRDFYASLWKSHEFNCSNTNNITYKALSGESNLYKCRNKDLLETLLWICQNDKLALSETISLLKASNLASIDVFDLSDAIINNVSLPQKESSIIFEQAQKNCEKHNYIRGLFLIKKFIGLGNAETPAVYNLLSNIYKFHDEDKSKEYNIKYINGLKTEYVDIDPIDIEPILVWFGNKETLKLKVAQIFKYESETPKDFSTVRRKVILPDISPTAPIKTGDIIGKVEYYCGNFDIGDVAIVAAEDVLFDKVYFLKNSYYREMSTETNLSTFENHCFPTPLSLDCDDG